ncbi:hypothetical protein EDB81DRAFT_243074 [Dactylonectria macrodidyma]|uniref:Heterokaryon incompatibility domain-containing protein n=1 Tax=Dactylonectria macrodidyma TaxID=307937 RepID=A0A9P9ID82_9HYPO|nr:hypothetical protein EDB81DRAFT_243074 [Dactylonectria macrodidyma]
MSTESKIWASSRVQTCEMLHATCQIKSCSFMPTRLLRLQEHSSSGQLFVRLEQMTASRMNVDAREERYSTLTYCWGGVQDVQLNANTEGMLTRGIPASSLHKTLLDATLVTWDMGLRLVWIDCLCILQDNPLDIVSEIDKLPEIYGNSFITISAARASNSREGFLQRTSLPAVSKPAFKLPFACPDGRPGSAILSSGLLNSPIESRAWTLQEYVLSRRVLQFTQAGFHWTCSQIALFQEDEDALPLLFAQRLRRSYRMYTGIRGGDRTCRSWMNIVEEYTKRDLTYSSDKLAAISGIGELWGKTSEDSYAAGLWVSHLPLGLLWTSAQPHMQSGLAEYLAPTWSWASLSGQVDWFDHVQTMVDPSVMIVSCKATPAYENAPYGKVSSGALTIRGRLQKTALEDELSPKSASTASSGQADNEILDLEMADIHLDLWDEALKSRIRRCKLFCLQICSFDETSSRGPSGLILATEDERLFRRVGVFFFEHPQDHDVERLGHYKNLAHLAESILRIQRSAFQHVATRTIIIV